MPTTVSLTVLTTATGDRLDGRLHRLCHALKKLAAAHNSVQGNSVSLDSENLPFVCAIADPEHCEEHTAAEMAR